MLPKKPHKKWSNLHLSNNVIQARENLKTALISNSNTTINTAREELQKSYKSAEECFIETQIHIIENASFSNKHALAWNVLNEVTGRKADSPPAKVEGSVEERKEKWKVYFEKLLGQPPKVSEDNFEISPVVDHTLPTEVGRFTLPELQKALKSTKKGGAVGIDAIPHEIWASP